MQYPTQEQIVDMQAHLLQQTGGMAGIRDQNGLESAIAQPQMAFGGKDLYPTIEKKAAAIGLSLVMNHPFVDGNKRIGHAAMELFLLMNGYELLAPVDDAEQTILRLAAGELSREALVEWIKSHMNPLS